MIRGSLDQFTDKDLDALVDAVFSVLEHTGLRIYSDKLLAACAAKGAKVENGIAHFPASMLADVVQHQRSRPEPPLGQSGHAYSASTRGPRAAVGMLVAPFFYDFEAQGPRPATTEDLVNSIRFGDVINPPEDPVTIPVTRQDAPAMQESIEAYAIQLENTSNPGGSWCSHVAQVPYVLEMNEIWFGDPRHFYPSGVHCMTSPLTMGRMMCRFVLLKAEHGIKDLPASVMPISGGNSPVTPAGNIVVSACEILGAWAAMLALVPDARLSGGTVGGSLDMRRGAPSFNSPEALLQNAGVCELFRRRFGGHVQFAGGSDYIETTAPGLSAAWEKVFASMAAATIGGQGWHLGASGSVDAGRCFSPEQLLIERDLLDMVWRFGQGTLVDSESLATTAIDAVGAGEGKSYLDQEHTLRNYRRALWQPELLSRELWGQERAIGTYEKRILDTAHERYLQALRQWQPPRVDEQKMKAVWQVVDQAKRELAGLSYGD